MSYQWKSILRNSIIEIIGEKQAAELYNTQFSSDPTIEEIHSRLEEMLGNPSALGVEQRIGQAGFRYFLAQMGYELGFFLPKLKLLPTRQKAIKGFGLLMDFYQKVDNEKVVFTETDEEYHLEITKGTENTSKQYHGCHFLIGFIQEYMAWVGSGRIFQVKESECRSNGHNSCIYNISKVPFD
jgi:predicted hydrocarbon binding protein